MKELLTRANKGNQDWCLKIFYKEFEDLVEDINSNETYKILLIKSGKGILNINGVRQALFSSTLFILNNEDRISIENIEGIDSKCIYFHPQAINSCLNFDNIKTREGTLSQTEIQDIALFKNFIEDEKIIELPPSTVVHIEEFFTNIQGQLSLQPDGYWPCRARSYLLELLIFVERFLSSNLKIESSINNLNSDDGNNILLYLYNNLHNKITIDDITKNLGLNRNLVQKHMYNSTGCSAMSYLQKIRVHLASIMLRDTGIPISEIADRCGFMDTNSFGRTFKKTTCFTPSEYRTHYSK